jgi:hypothetical protein
MERLSRPVNEAANPVLLGFQPMIGESVELLIPQRMGLGFCEVEATGIQHLIQRHPRKPRFDEIGNRVQCLDNFPCGVEFRRRCFSCDGEG